MNTLILLISYSIKDKKFIYLLSAFAFLFCSCGQAPGSNHAQLNLMDSSDIHSIVKSSPSPSCLIPYPPYPIPSGDPSEFPCTPDMTVEASPFPTAVPSGQPSSSPEPQVAICHVPPGNIDNRQTLCVSLSGAEDGHGIVFSGALGGHGGDFPGPCETACPTAVPSPTPTPSPSPTPTLTPAPTPAPIPSPSPSLGSSGGEGGNVQTLPLGV